MKVIPTIKYFLFKPLIFVALVSANPVRALELSIAPFTLYEHTPSPIIVDGVSTKYRLGVIGGQLSLRSTENFNVTARLGFGQNNNQEVTFGGAKFTGKVTGYYFDMNASKAVLSLVNSTISIGAGYSNRNLEATDLNGYRNGLALTGSSKSKISSTDLLVKIDHKLSRKFYASASLGYAKWHMFADANAYFSQGGIRANANKKIDTTGYDPVYKLDLAYKIRSNMLKVGFSQQNLSSKANTDILSLEVLYQMNF